MSTTRSASLLLALRDDLAKHHGLHNAYVHHTGGGGRGGTSVGAVVELPLGQYHYAWIDFADGEPGFRATLYSKLGPDEGLPLVTAGTLHDVGQLLRTIVKANGQ